jgi:hypothetical protein
VAGGREWGSFFMEKLEQQVAGLLQELLRLTKVQAEIIRTEGQPGADENLAARKNCIEKLAVFPDAGQYAENSPEIRKLLTEIQTLERLNQEVLQEKLDYVAGQLKKTRDGQAAMRHYDGVNIDIGATYFDKKK